MSNHPHLMPSIIMKKRRAASTNKRQKRIQMAKAVRPVASDGVAWQNHDKDIKMFIFITSKTELNMLMRTSRVVMRSPLRLAMSSLGRRKLDQETATKNPAHM